jgi:hypothetical protein
MGWAEDMGDRSTSRTDVLRASRPMFDSRLLDALSRVHPAMPTLTAAGLCAEVGDFRRFAKPALLSGFLG